MPAGRRLRNASNALDQISTLRALGRLWETRETMMVLRNPAGEARNSSSHVRKTRSSRAKSFYDGRVGETTLPEHYDVLDVIPT